MNEAELKKQGACHGLPPDMFFPKDTAGVEEAKRICEGCPVREPCLEYSLVNDVDGVWGGTTARERRRIRRVSSAAARQLGGQAVNKGQ